MNEICNCTLIKTQLYNLRDGGKLHINTLLALYTLLKNTLYLNLRHTNSISQSKTMEDQDFG